MSNEHIENGFSSFAFRTSDTLPNVFLIGDSIRLGYCSLVKEALSGEAQVFFPRDNCRSTHYVITSMRTFASSFDKPEAVKLVLFNCGHWDVAHWDGLPASLSTESEYARNIGIIITLIRKMFPSAKIIFATTTPMNPEKVGDINPRSNEEIDVYNRIATDVCLDEGVQVLDLNALARSLPPSAYQDYCHYKKPANEFFAAEIAKAILAAL